MKQNKQSWETLVWINKAYTLYKDQRPATFFLFDISALQNLSQSGSQTACFNTSNFMHHLIVAKQDHPLRVITCDKRKRNHLIGVPSATCPGLNPVQSDLGSPHSELIITLCRG